MKSIIEALYDFPGTGEAVRRAESSLRKKVRAKDLSKKQVATLISRSFEAARIRAKQLPKSDPWTFPLYGSYGLLEPYTDAYGTRRGFPLFVGRVGGNVSAKVRAAIALDLMVKRGYFVKRGSGVRLTPKGLKRLKPSNPVPDMK